MDTDWVEGYRSYECCVGLDRSSPNSRMYPGRYQPLPMTKHSPLTGPDQGTIKEEGKEGLSREPSALIDCTSSRG